MAPSTPREMRIKEIERNNWWVVVALAGASGLWSTFPFTLSVLAGGLVMALNFYLWRTVVGSLLQTQWDRDVRLGGVMFKITAKFFALLGVTALLFLHVGIHPLGFLLGSTNLLISTLLAGVSVSQLRRASSRLDG